MLLLSQCASPRYALRILIFFAAAIVLTSTAWLYHHAPERQAPIRMPHDYEPPKRRTHPIDYLVTKSEATFKLLLAKESNNLTAAAEAYRERRGRHPPPGFDAWYKFAKDRNALIIEDFFDQIYHDLTPFWGVDAGKIQRSAKHWPISVNVRNQTATMRTDEPREWMDLWRDMTAGIQEWLPDLDMPINFMDESRVIAHWEKVDRLVTRERASRALSNSSETVTQFSGLGQLDANPGKPLHVDWIREGAFWDTARVGCAPDSPGRRIPAANDFSGPPPIPTGFPLRSPEGFVQNWTATKDPCQNPDLRESHGTFIEPVSQATTHDLIPVFSGSKLPMNNDILIPAAMYWSHDVRYNEPSDGGPWEKKKTKVMWRGSGTGGRNRDTTWTRFHRHRFVSMVNGTAVQAAESNPENHGQGPNFLLQSYKTYKLTATKYMDLGSWLNKIADAGLVWLACFPGTGGAHCPYTDAYYTLKKAEDMKFMFGYKFLPDIDGNSFSGRYLSFLRSTSLPIKATIYSEWHDSRLMPWVHFVPMDNSFLDVYGILDYFIGTGTEFKTAKGKTVVEGAHDKEAKKIALAGKEWADKVLRREDMQIYLLRLLLEYARVADKQRDRLGWVDDLK